MNQQMMIQAIVFYVPLSVAFIWLGIGLVRARRWAWTLTVVLSWIWLIIGVVAFAMIMLFMGPTTWASIAKQGADPARSDHGNARSSPVRSWPASIFCFRAYFSSSVTASPSVQPVRGEIRRSAGPTAVPCRCSP